MKKIYLVCFHISHIDPKDQKCKHFFDIPSEQPNQAQFFVCVCV